MKKMTTLAILLMATLTAFAQTPEQWATLKKDIHFFLANDLGRTDIMIKNPLPS